MRHNVLSAMLRFHIQFSKLLMVLITLFMGFAVMAQPERPKNYRKFDERTFHFGFMMGGNTTGYTAFPKLNAYADYGMKSLNVVPQPGGQLGILSTMKLGHPVVRLRMIPTISFQERLVRQVFVDAVDPNKDRINEERINSTNVDVPLLLQFRTTRLNNFAAYCFTGAQYTVDLQSLQDASQSFIDPFLKMKKHDVGGQIGAGIEFFAVYFKFGMELKYHHGFNNVLIQDNTPISRPIDRMYNRGWLFSIIFEG